MSCRARSAGVPAGGEFRLDSVQGGGRLFAVAEIAPKGIDVRGREMLPQRKRVGRIGVKSRQVDNDPEVCGVHAERFQEIRFCLFPFSRLQGSDSTEIIGPSGLCVGGPALARFQEFQTRGVPAPFNEGAGRFELSFPKITEGVCCDSEEYNRCEKDPVERSEALHTSGGISHAFAIGGRRGTRKSSEKNEDQESPPEQKDLHEHPRGNRKGAQGHGMLGKRPERNPVRGLGNVEDVVHDDRKKGDEKYSSTWDTRESQRESDGNREGRREEKGVTEKVCGVPPCEEKYLPADIRGVREEDGEESPKTVDDRPEGTVLSFRFRRPRNHGRRESDKCMPYDGNGVPPVFQESGSVIPNILHQWERRSMGEAGKECSR